jgi:predicted nuclease of restriction endonuclease-like (RecB) superfamily
MKPYIEDIRQILERARQKAYSATNFAMVEAYWLVGKRIVEEEQAGDAKAEYGAEIIKNISKELSQNLGRGFSETNVRSFRMFYLTFPDIGAIQQTVSAKLSWSHFQLIMRVSDKNAQQYYLKEAAEQNWAVRTLERNINTLYYQRLLSSQFQQPVEEEMKGKTKAFQQDTHEFIKNPTVLEFLNIPTLYAYTEQHLEQTLIDNLQQFLLELGKGFAFVARQKHIRTETQDFFIDLVFYNYVLKCFVIVELKTDKINHQDIGQLDMYVRMFDDLERKQGDNPTIGILLCTDTDRTIARYSVLHENKQLFASKYLPYLPSEEELAAEIEREKQIIRLKLKDNEL